MGATEVKRILIVEDEHSICQMMRDVLEMEGYEVYIAYDGEEGLKTLRKLSPLPSLVLLDLMMPGTNGWQFLDYQRSDKELSKIPVIICSAYLESAKAIKPAGILEKPVKLESLLQTVKNYCA